jgi:hypothetical protein
MKSFRYIKTQFIDICLSVDNGNTVVRVENKYISFKEPNPERI